MVHANFENKRHFSQQLEYFEIRYFEVGGQRYIPRKRSFSGIKGLLGSKA